MYIAYICVKKREVFKKLQFKKREGNAFDILQSCSNPLFPLQVSDALSPAFTIMI